MDGPETDWSAPRPLASRAPALVVGAAAVAIAVVLLLAFRGGMDVPSQVAAHYAALMADTLRPDVRSGEASDVARTLEGDGLGFAPHVVDLSPDFGLHGGGVHRLADRPAAFWYYRDRRSDTLLVEAFTGTLAQLGRPSEMRDQAPATLHVFRKATQTLVFWQRGAQVYVVTTTLPGERTIALARRLAQAPAEGRESGGTEP